MAAAASENKAGKSGMIVTFAVLTVLACGGGALMGKLIGMQGRPAAAPTSETPKPYSNGTEIKELPPILANLADSRGTVARLQAAVVYAKKPEENPAILLARIGDDFIAYVKTLTFAQLQGASGLQSLREDLNERAKLRSQGAVREVIIEALVTQ